MMLRCFKGRLGRKRKKKKEQKEERELMREVEIEGLQERLSGSGGSLSGLTSSGESGHPNRLGDRATSSKVSWDRCGVLHSAVSFPSLRP